jgi:hypothetical protein
MAFLYKGTDEWSGVKWCVRTVYWHDSYGLNDMLVYGGDYNPYERQAMRIMTQGSRSEVSLSVGIIWIR